MSFIPQGMSFIPQGMSFIPQGMSFIPHCMSYMGRCMSYMQRCMSYMTLGRRLGGPESSSKQGTHGACHPPAAPNLGCAAPR
jgi:hypothetical protein